MFDLNHSLTKNIKIMSKCPNCGAQGGSITGCSSCGLGRDPNVGRHLNAGQDRIKIEQEKQRRKQYGGADCFPKGTKILTPNGAVDISKLSIGDEVSSYNFKNKIIETKKVIKIVPKHLSRNLITMCLANGEVITCTMNHPFSVNGGWIKAKNLKGKTILLTSSDIEAVKVENIETVADEVEVFNIIVEDNYNFIAEGALVHSFAYFRILQVIFYNLLKRISFVTQQTEVSLSRI